MSAWSTPRCEYGRLARKRECSAVDVIPQFTKRFRETGPRERQPVYLCEKHRVYFPSVSPIDGRMIRRASAEIKQRVKR